MNKNSNFNNRRRDGARPVSTGTGNRITAILLNFALMLGLFAVMPQTARAYFTTIQGGMVTAQTTSEKMLREAIAKAASGDTMRLIGDVPFIFSEGLTVSGKNITCIFY